MARGFNPIRTTGALAALAADLRALMKESGLTYRQMAERCARSQGPLSSAADGVHLPTWATVEAYVTACGGNPAAWRARYLAAKQEFSASHNGAGEPVLVETVRLRPNPPSPFDARSPEDFIDLLHQVRMWAGEPSWRVLAGKMGVPTSTLHSMLHRDTLPAAGLLKRFLHACGADNADDWMLTRMRLAYAQDRARRRPTSRPVPTIRKRI